MEYKAFKEEEVPYGVLSQFGLTQEMIEDLPMSVLESIHEGRLSPVLPIEMKDDKGDIVKSRSRFKLSRMEDGNVNVLFYPQFKSCDLNQYDDKQQEALLSGGAIVAASPEDKDVKCFVQIDPETNHVMYVPTPVIGRNIHYISERYHLTSTEIQKIQNGEALTILSEDEDTFTVGIDLNARTGIRFAAGDEETWKRESKRDYGKYKFGIFGCWVTDNDGNMDYVEENDYTDEMWNEQKKQGMRGLQR